MYKPVVYPDKPVRHIAQDYPPAALFVDGIIRRRPCHVDGIRRARFRYESMG